jgi:photosystem II stability/assembly factor-like uncharacterized protein
MGTGGSGTGTGGSGGAPPGGTWVSVTSNLAGMVSECGNMSHLSAKPDEDMLIAGIALKGLWASVDGGESWHPLGMGAGSAAITNRTSSIVYDPQNPARYWESGLYNEGGVYTTTDDGNTLVPVGDVRHSDLVTIDFADPARKTLLAGGHEQAKTLNRTSDGGATWTNVGVNLPDKTACTFPLLIDAQTHLVGCTGYQDGPDVIFRTTDGGANWLQVSTLGGYAAPLRASDHSIYWAIPQNKGVARSTDDGQTWTSLAGSNVVRSAHPIELPDGRLVGVGSSLMISADHGASWRPISAQLPYGDAVGVVYSTFRKAFYVWHFSCGAGAPVPTDAIMQYSFDYQTQ